MSEHTGSGCALAIQADDGTTLQAQLFAPGASARSRSQVLIAGGIGIPQRFYAPFARWLASRGHHVMTFDLRGIGASRAPRHRRSLRGLDADLLTWARQDFAAAVRVMATRAGDAGVAVMGHSLGAHHAGMSNLATQARIRRLVSIAAGSGYWRDWAPPSRWKAPLLLHLAGPLLTPLWGYFPGRRLRMVGDLPAGVMRQWGRWCRHPDFAWGAEPDEVLGTLRAARFPIDAYSFTDDEAMTEACTRKLLAAYSQAPSTLRVLAPADVGMARIGHLGAMRPEAEAKLWPLLASHLETDPA